VNASLSSPPMAELTISDHPRTATSLWRGVVRACRPKQWAKNGLVLVAPALAIADGTVPDGARAMLQAVLAFVAFSMVASGTYLINDAVDVEADRLHPTKRERPIAGFIRRPTQHAGDVVSGLLGQAPSKNNNLAVALMFAVGMLLFVFKSRDFRESFDNILSGAVVGLAIVAGWYLTGGPLGQSWKDYADMATEVPSRVQVQSFTFISPMGDTLRYLLDPSKWTLINFGVAALAGVIFGSFIYSAVTKNLRIEWFASFGDFVNHAIGGALMGIGGVLSMGCTVGQAITGMSTLAIGSMLTFVAIVAGAATTMKFQYWRMMREA